MDQRAGSRGCDLFKEQRRKVFADFYKLLRETRNRYPDTIGQPHVNAVSPAKGRK
jgi:hypothetical protein